MTEPKCPSCEHSFLIINLWGFPVEEEIITLESAGHTANVKGCVPPEVGEEAFQFECQSCGYKFVEYGEDNDD